MQEIPVGSSLILAAAYDDAAQELHVTFKNGARWIYGNNVRPFTAEDAALFESAVSKGQWFLGQIKGQYPERRA